MGAVERYDIWRPPPTSLKALRDPSDMSFPTGTIIGYETALVLFAQAWYGKQDAVYVAQAGLRATCVDYRDHNFAAMRDLYADDWEFVQADAYQFIQETDRQWDVVTVDCPSGHFQQCADLLPRFGEIARHVIVLGTGVGTEFMAPRGWVWAEEHERSKMYGGVYWSVFTHA